MQPATAVKNSPGEAPVNFWTWLERNEERLAMAMVLVYVVVFGPLALVRHGPSIPPPSTSASQYRPTRTQCAAATTRVTVVAGIALRGEVDSS